MKMARPVCGAFLVSTLALICVAVPPAYGAPSAPINTTWFNIEHNILHFSYALQQWLDVAKRPCQDFYGYVCAKSLNTTQAQAERSAQQKQQNFENFLSNDNEEQLMDAELKLKQFFVSCKSARSQEDLKSSLMYRVSGGWPAIDDSPAMIRKRRNSTWLDVLSFFHEAGVHYFFRTQVGVQSNRRIVQLLLDTDTRYSLRKFEQLVGEVLQEHAVDAGRARLVALETLSFERSRRELMRKQLPEELAELSYEQFRGLSSSALQPEWDAYFKKLLGKTLKPNDTIAIPQLPKLLDYFQLLQNTSMTRLLNWIWIDYLMDKASTNCQQLVETYFEPVYQHIVQRAGVDRKQMAQMYSELGRSYSQILVSTPWIDEISQLNSQQMLGRVIHMTLNGDSTLDADYQELQLTNRNFYRNLEKVQRFLAQSQRKQSSNQAGESLQVATDFMKVLLLVNALLQQQQNLTTPLNYALLSASFSEQMIAAGASSGIPGAWRSMDSEKEYGTFQRCVTLQKPAATANASNYNLNDLILKLLAQRQALHALDSWQQSEAGLTRRLNNLLSAGRLQLSLQKLYFVGSALLDCRQHADAAMQKELLHSYLRNSQQFSQAFGCSPSEQLYARNVCPVF